MQLLTKHRLILASKSPRRSQLLRDAGIDFEIRTREVDESFPEDIPKSEVAAYLAEKKADACKDFLESPADILLTADSTVVLGQEIFNKPAQREDAIAMLKRLSGNRHTVFTGVCLLSFHKKIVFTGVSHVDFDTLSSEEIHFYVDACQPFDKAGSYAIQEWIGLCRVRSIEGTFSNIMGLPVYQVYEALKHWEE